MFDGRDGPSLAAAVQRALDCRAHRPAHWTALVRQAMARDASWPPSARRYVALYRTRVPAAVQAQPAESATQVH
jgi:glycogen synthase